MAIVILGKPSRKGPARMITTRVRLYDTYVDTGFKFLAYAAGDEVPVEEYERLCRMNSVVTPEIPPAPPEPDVPKSLSESSRADLLVQAKQMGLRPSARIRKDDLVGMIESARSEA
jgi:hypothetical protein